VLLGVYPLTIAEAPTQQKSRKRQQQNPKDTPRYVQRMVGYIMGRKRE
jgi:hypothetical protein